MGSDPKRVQAVFLAAVELPPVERAAVLDRECGPDGELRHRVQALLLAHEQPGSFLERPVVDQAITGDQPASGAKTGGSGEVGPPEGPGSRIGPYKLLEPIGVGGMGTVWLAEQQEPVRRLVAVKVIKAGMDSAQIVARFAAERQALSLMDHPHIAKLLDAGTTDSGRPYFAMELVKGIPITTFCDEHRLRPGQRLELFVSVCQAIQHAHQKGIIHRDVKPSNVLVARYDGRPVPKVIDFGVAKATGQRLTERTLVTGFGHLVGTLEYMSPEQAEFNALDVDTRSDIYSLGVLLYELLTGTTPLTRQRLKETALAELLRTIREEEPPRPSTRLSASRGALAAISAQRQMEPAQLTKLVRGELDWIVMKALEKDRTRRYETASALAADVQRYLDNEPVEACPPSALYQFRKFARRNKAVLRTVLVVAVVLLLAVAALAVSTTVTWRANRELHQALERERDTLERERQNGYYQRIALAEREWSANNLSRALELLTDCPAELRGWEWHYLNRLLHGQGPLVLRHEAAVLCAAISPDGERLASGDQAGGIRIWQARTGQLLRRFQAHPEHVRNVAFSPDGRRLASASWDGMVKVWDLETGQAVLALKGPHPSANAVAFSPDGQLLAASGGNDRRGVVRVWDAATGQELRSWERPTGDIGCLAFSPDGRRLATGCWHNGEVKLWDPHTGRETLNLSGLLRHVEALAFSRDGRLLVAGGGPFPGKPPPGFTPVVVRLRPADRAAEGPRVDGGVNDTGLAQVWDLAQVYPGGEAHPVLTLGGHVRTVGGVAFSPDGRRLATGGRDAVVMLWDLGTGQETLTLRGHTSYVRSVRFSPDGQRLVTASHDGTVRTWDAEPPPPEGAGSEILTLHGGRRRRGVESVAFHPGGRYLAAIGNGIVTVWDVRTGKELYAEDQQKGQCLAYSPDGRLLVSRFPGLAVRVADAATGETIRIWTLAGHTDGLTTIAFSPSGRHLASGSYDCTVRIWDVRTGREVQCLRGHNWWIAGVAFSPDGRRLASASGDRTIRLWDLATGQEVANARRTHEDAVTGVAFSPDGKLLASGSQDQTVRVWDAETLDLRHLLRDPTGRVLSVAFSPDGRRLAWGGTDATVKVWDIPTERGRGVNGVSPQIHTLRGHTGWVQCVAFSPDGQHIASASADGTVKVWDVPAVAEPRREPSK